MRPTFLSLISALAAGAACAPVDNEPEATPDAGTALNAMPAIADLTPETWTELSPGGDTKCSRGQDWGFFFRPGTVDKLVIEFQGGGACWNYFSCSVADAIFKDNIDDVRTAVLQGARQGIYDHTRADNPFAGWNHLFIPYCTGDIHWGRATVEYTQEDTGESLFLEHRGAINTEVALRWAQENIASPEAIFITGCSAGSYGSIGWAPHVMRAYPDAQVVQMGDCGAGIITESFLEDSFPVWEATKMLPDWIDAISPDQIDLSTTHLADIYIGTGAHYTNQMLTQYNTLSDRTQVLYFDYMGGEGGADAWSVGMRDSIHRIDQSLENFRYFIAPGKKHCIVPYNEFYEVEAGGVRLVDWLRGLFTDTPPASIACDGCDPAPAP